MAAATAAERDPLVGEDGREPDPEPADPGRDPDPEPASVSPARITRVHFAAPVSPAEPAAPPFAAPISPAEPAGDTGHDAAGHGTTGRGRVEAF